MKEKKHCKCLLQYCDDVTSLAKTKAEAWSALNEFERLSDAEGFIVKANAIVAPIACLIHGKKKHQRKRQRGHRKAN